MAVILSVPMWLTVMVPRFIIWITHSSLIEHISHASTILFGMKLILLLQTKLTETGPRFNIKMTSYQYRKTHCGDKTIFRPSYLHNGISYTDKMTSLYWIRALIANPNYTAGDLELRSLAVMPFHVFPKILTGLPCCYRFRLVHYTAE